MGFTHCLSCFAIKSRGQLWRYRKNSRHEDLIKNGNTSDEEIGGVGARPRMSPVLPIATRFLHVFLVLLVCTARVASVVFSSSAGLLFSAPPIILRASRRLEFSFSCVICCCHDTSTLPPLGTVSHIAASRDFLYRCDRFLQETQWKVGP